MEAGRYLDFARAYAAAAVLEGDADRRRLLRLEQVRGWLRASRARGDAWIEDADHSSDPAVQAASIEIRTLLRYVRGEREGLVEELRRARDLAKRASTDAELQKRLRWLLVAGTQAVEERKPQEILRMLKDIEELLPRAGSELVPASVLERPPTAELRPGQRDEDSLPPYELLDQILEAYVERDEGRARLVGQGFDEDVVNEVIRMVDRAEYKRRQAPPGTRISSKAFGRDRRLPITNQFAGLRPRLPR